MNDQKLILTKYNGTQAAFLTENNRLIHVMLQSTSDCNIGDIYVGRVKDMIPAMDGAFVQFTERSVGFLPLSNLKSKNILNRTDADTLKSGDEVLVQVSKEPLKTKDAMLTTDLSFSGKYLVLIPYSHGIFYSKKFTKAQKEQLSALITDIAVELFGDMNIFLQQYGLIVRTAAITADVADVGRELHELFHEASSILSCADKRTMFSCLHKEDSVYVKALKNLFHPENNQIVTDDELFYQSLCQDPVFDFIPKDRITYYCDDRLSLRKLYGIDEKLQSAVSKKVWLKSGGYLVIEPTEALTVIDVNSGKSSIKQNKMNREDFYYKVNAEAAAEVAHQLRLRNISGIIIVDFLKNGKDNTELLLKQLRSAVKADPVETVIVGETALGLVEITRKKTEASLYEKIQQLNP
nr:ribonuclease E/G [Lachnospiraceae bacterium]